MLMNTGEEAVASKNNLLTTVAWQIEGKDDAVRARRQRVHRRGSHPVAARGDGHPRTPPRADARRRHPDTGGMYVVPAFVGLGAPYWDAYARGAILGLTRGSERAHIAATLEASPTRPATWSTPCAPIPAWRCKRCASTAAWCATIS
ncbi:MAG: FGGY-family carbohydrate kinase [Anaerolineae bacterium]